MKTDINFRLLIGSYISFSKRMFNKFVSSIREASLMSENRILLNHIQISKSYFELMALMYGITSATLQTREMFEKFIW